MKVIITSTYTIFSPKQLSSEWDITLSCDVLGSLRRVELEIMLIVCVNIESPDKVRVAARGLALGKGKDFSN